MRIRILTRLYYSCNGDRIQPAGSSALYPIRDEEERTVFKCKPYPKVASFEGHNRVSFQRPSRLLSCTREKCSIECDLYESGQLEQQLGEFKRRFLFIFERELVVLE